jgi:hypothetical protein
VSVIVGVKMGVWVGVAVLVGSGVGLGTVAVGEAVAGTRVGIGGGVAEKVGAGVRRLVVRDPAQATVAINKKTQTTRICRK